MRNILVCLMLFLGFGAATNAQSDLDPLRQSIPNEDWEDFERLSQRVDVLQDFKLLGADVYLSEPTRNEIREYPNYRSVNTRILSRLRHIKPRLEALAYTIGANKPKELIFAAITNSVISEAAAYTGCVDISDGPGKTCYITVNLGRADVLHNDYLDFYLAHELGHTLQKSTHTTNQRGSHWWIEGSAEWIAHKVVPRVTHRDERVNSFISSHSYQPINQFSYPAQVFYFWGARYFDDAWVMEHGFNGDDYLSSTQGAAESMGPNHWLEWAAAHIEGNIFYPDGRPVTPTQSTVITVPSHDRCEEENERVAVHSGPPLSAQILTLNLSGDTTEKIFQVDAGAAWMRIYGLDREPEDIRTGAATFPLNGQRTLKVAAIVPGITDLSVSFRIDDPSINQSLGFMGAGGETGQIRNQSNGSGCGCAGTQVTDSCIIGRWKLESDGADNWLNLFSSMTGFSVKGEQIGQNEIEFFPDGRYEAVENMAVSVRRQTADGVLNQNNTSHSVTPTQGQWCITPSGRLEMRETSRNIRGQRRMAGRGGRGSYQASGEYVETETQDEHSYKYSGNSRSQDQDDIIILDDERILINDDYETGTNTASIYGRGESSYGGPFEEETYFPNLYQSERPPISVAKYTCNEQTLELKFLVSEQDDMPEEVSTPEPEFDVEAYLEEQFRHMEEDAYGTPEVTEMLSQWREELEAGKNEHGAGKTQDIDRFSVLDLFPPITSRFSRMK